jgi:hypothetical protein
MIATIEGLTLLESYKQAALRLAQHVSIIDRIKSDPTYWADRSAHAWELRDADYAEALEEFRAAETAFMDSVSR